jgi:uncharacterized membrane protein YukC
MNWFEEWFKLQTIGTYIALGLLALAVIAFIIYIIYVFISWEYKKHSKKWEWNCLINDYVRVEDKEEK